MKKYLMLFAAFACSITLLSAQSSWTHNDHYEGSYTIPVTAEWVAEVVWSQVVNHVHQVNREGQMVTKYTIHYRDKWNYTNLVTGETATSPGVQNVTGDFITWPDGFSNDRRFIEHFVKDPIYGSAHLVFRLIWEENPETGFIEIVEIQNEWQK